MRVFTLINLVLWVVLFGLWIPYVLAVGIGDATSQQVLLILSVTAVLIVLLGAYRMSRRRAILG